MNYQNIVLGEVADVTIGLVVNRKKAGLNDIVSNNYKMLTLKSFEQDGWLNTGNLEAFQSSVEIDNKYLTQQGDIIVRLSYPHTSVVIEMEQMGILIPSLFAVIRVHTDYLMSEYLNVYLNSDYIKQCYSKDAIGSAIQIIRTGTLKEIIVDVPDIEKQRKIVELNKLIISEKNLLSKLIEEKTKYNKEIINNLITGGIENGD